MKRLARSISGLILASTAACALAGGGPLGIDSEVGSNATGIWSRGHQRFVEDATVAAVLAGAPWGGADTRFGGTPWQSGGAVALGPLGHAIANRAAGRVRPS